MNSLTLKILLTLYTLYALLKFFELFFRDDGTKVEEFRTIGGDPGLRCAARPNSVAAVTKVLTRATNARMIEGNTSPSTLDVECPDSPGA